MAYAEPSDVAARLGRELDTDETNLVAARLDDAELILKLRIPDLDDRVTASETFEQAVIMIECEMVLRLVRNPEGYTQETDGNYSYTIRASVASGRLQVLPEEWGMLGVVAGMGMLEPVFAPYPYPPGSEADVLHVYTEEQAIKDGWA